VIGRRVGGVLVGEARFAVGDVSIRRENDRAANPYPDCWHFAESEKCDDRDEGQLGEFKRLELRDFSHPHRTGPA